MHDLDTLQHSFLSYTLVSVHSNSSLPFNQSHLNSGLFISSRNLYFHMFILVCYSQSKSFPGHAMQNQDSHYISFISFIFSSKLKHKSKPKALVHSFVCFVWIRTEFILFYFAVCLIVNCRGQIKIKSKCIFIFSFIAIMEQSFV